MWLIKNSVQIPQSIQDKFTIVLINPITFNLNDTGISKEKDNLFRLTVFSVTLMWSQLKPLSVPFSVTVIKFTGNSNVK